MTTNHSMPLVTQRLRERNREAQEAMIAAEVEADHKRAQLDEEGPEALLRLIKVADGASGQSQHCRRVLLSVYNGAAWPLDPTRLRLIDRELQEAALTLIEWSIRASDEPHTYVCNGGRLMQRYAAIEQEAQ
ncbi:MULTISPECIES: DUF7673 family protein [unclassified Halomonas]|uniref:DUF7673 family protein n=1 Tax=unclassified Halomonas TaxID=2609666 RepID=UPI00048601BE|nr:MULTISPECIES: hypothetical protein [unclassified Halomonas]PKH63500.1 hypothetical protein CXF94_01585 [Halomonas sp. Choline-3u-9]QGQ69800.1 hypothetical protein FDY98_06455 [Halomonas sp. PA16-9]